MLWLWSSGSWHQEDYTVSQPMKLYKHTNVETPMVFFMYVTSYAATKFGIYQGLYVDKILL
jgi:hypothetical protein